MCGICGVVSGAPTPAMQLRQAVRSMGAWLHHRGPDAWGEHVSERVALGHNRLAILDIEGGHQPMSSADGNVWVVFNGEIYNYHVLWRELQSKGHSFHTDHSDTEVLVNGYVEWGEELFARLDGMFAIAIWDAARQRVLLARDRIGIKPLYFAEREAGHGLVFASEPKALVGGGLVSAELRPEGLAEYFLYRAPIGPGTLWKNIQKLQPGTWRAFDLACGLGAPRVFWRPAAMPRHGISASHARAELETRLEQAVQSHLMSDVPVGIFLSGGVDSSIVAALMSRYSKLTAFTIGSDSALDESRYAATVASRFGLPFVCRRVQGEDYLAHFDNWMYVNDDPSADPSALALMLITERAREQGVKVMLAGEGGDEFFGGYSSYLRYGAFAALAKQPFGAVGASLLAKLGSERERDYARRFRQGLAFLGTAHLTSLSTRVALLAPELRESARFVEELGQDESAHGAEPIRAAMLADQRVRLPNDLLMRTDRATMFFSLEARVPLLDNGVMTWANGLPDKFCVRLLDQSTKRLLKQVAARFIPSEIVYRPKRGFDIPLRQWLTTNFREIQMQFLAERSVPFLNYKTIESLVNTLSMRPVSLVSDQVWAWITLEKWYRLWMQHQAQPRLPSAVHALSFEALASRWSDNGCMH